MDIENIKNIVLTAIGSVGGIGGVVVIICRIISSISNLKEKKYLTKYKADVNNALDAGLDKLADLFNKKSKTQLSIDISKYLNEAVKQEMETQTKVNNLFAQKMDAYSLAMTTWMNILAEDFKGVSPASKEKLKEAIGLIDTDISDDKIFSQKQEEKFIETVELSEPISLKETVEKMTAETAGYTA